MTSEVWAWIVQNANMIVSAATGGLAASAGWLVDRYRRRGAALSDARREAMQKSISDNASDIRAAEDELGSLRSRVTSLERSDTQMQEMIAQLKSSVEAIDSDLQHISERQVPPARFERVEQQVDAIYNHVLTDS